MAVVFSASAVGVAGAGGPAGAATLTWDSDGATVPVVLDGAGTWHTAGNWYDGVNNVNWSDGNDAVFGGAAGLPGTVTIAATAQPNSITFNVDGYTVADTSASIGLIMPGTGGITANGDATIRTFRAALMQTGSATWTVASTKALTLDATPNGQFLVGGNADAGKTLALGGGGTVHFVAADTTFGLGVPMNSTLTINDATMTVTGRTAGTLQDGMSLVIRSRSDFNGPAGKVYVNTGGTIDLGLNYAAVQQNATGTPTFTATGPPGELHLDGGTIALAGFGNPTATTPLGSQGVVYLNGGRVKANTNNVNFIPAPWVEGVGGLGPRAMYVSAGGATINSNGFDVTSDNPLMADPDSSGGGFNKTGAGTLTMNAANTYTGPTSVDGGKLVLGKSLTSSSELSALNDATLELASDGTHNQIINTGEVGIASNARIDLRDNKLLTSTPVGNFDGSTYSGVQGQVARAYNFGGWDQPGVTTSMPEAGPNAGSLSNTTTIATAAASQVLFIEPTDTAVFQGQTVTGATTIAMYTYAGDLNMDGLIDGADYGVIDNNVQFPGTDGYANGDFNYDGVIDGADYGIIDNAIQFQGNPFPGVVFGAASSGAALSGVIAVPEPSACGFAILTGAALLARRCRRRREPTMN